MFLTIHDWSLPIRNPVFLFGVLLLTVLTAPALLQRFRLPGIAGLILAGALFGPHGINLLERGEGIQLLGQAGLLYIMFWAGLEINMTSFIKNRHKSLVFGGLTFLLPLSLGGFCAYYLLDFEWMGALLLASMFSTHTLISYPIVQRFRIAQNEAVAVTIGGTIITDTLALLMLAVISSMAQGAITGWFWVKLIISLALFGVIVFGLMPKVARWFFQRVESDLTYQYVFVLAVVFICGLLAELAGVEAIIGAFMAGLVLNRLIPHASPLMERIEFMGNALFIPAFLFSVGMLVNLHVFFDSKKVIVMALLLTAIALLTKWIAAITTRRIFQYTPDEGKLIFGLSSSHAAATIAIILIGYQVNLFGEDVLNAIVFLVLITCLVSTLMTDRVARKMAAETALQNPTAALTPQRILVPFANPSSLTYLIDFACLIKTQGQQTPIYPLSIILDEKDVREKMNQSRQIMEPVIRQATEKQIAVSPIHRVDVSAVSGILRAAKELPATEIVIGWKPLLSTTEKLFGTLHDNLLEETPEMLFVTHCIHPPFNFHQIKIVMPENSHLEQGFGDLVRRFDNLSLRLNAPILLQTATATVEVFRQMLSTKSKSRLHISPFQEDDWWKLHEHLPDDCLLVIVSGRWKGVSWENYQDKIPGYLAEHFEDKSFVLAFPGI